MLIYKYSSPNVKNNIYFAKRVFLNGQDRLSFYLGNMWHSTNRPAINYSRTFKIWYICGKTIAKKVD